MYKERDNYASLLEDTFLTEEKMEILEAKYEVINEAVGAAIIAAIIAAIGALIVLIAKVIKSMGSASNTVKSKVSEMTKQVEDKANKV